MSRLIDPGLEQLASMLYRMGELSRKTVSQSVNNYLEGKESNKQVQELSETLVFMSEQIEDKAFEVISRFQPVASDLRIIKSYMRIAYDLARYGRYALNISEVHERLAEITECEVWIGTLMNDMSEKALDMVNISINALKNHDSELAKTLSDLEEQVDRFYSTFLTKLMEKAPATNRCTIGSVLVVRYLERMADHAIYIGESIIYLVTGEKITLG
jgi:phosphate transport system protein